MDSEGGYGGERVDAGSEMRRLYRLLTLGCAVSQELAAVHDEVTKRLGEAV